MTLRKSKWLIGISSQLIATLYVILSQYTVDKQTIAHDSIFHLP